MTDTFTFGPSGSGNFTMKWYYRGAGSGCAQLDSRACRSYHEVQFITIKVHNAPCLSSHNHHRVTRHSQGLSHAPSLSDVVGTRVSVNLTRTGAFACSSALITRIYDTTINNYLGLTTGITPHHTTAAACCSCQCPHRHGLHLTLLQAACLSIAPTASAGDSMHPYSRTRFTQEHSF